MIKAILIQSLDSENWEQVPNSPVWDDIKIAEDEEAAKWLLDNVYVPNIPSMYYELVCPTYFSQTKKPFC